MKRILLTAACLVCLVANAQNYITDLDDVALLGTWNVTGFVGDFKFDYDYRGKEIKAIQFSDGNYTKIVFADGANDLDLIFKGYWISSAQTDKYFLHLSPWFSSQSIVNFRVTAFDGGNMTLTAYDNNGTLYLKKNDAAAVRAAQIDTTNNAKAYTLDGVELPTPNNVRGVIIQGGKKIIK